MDEIIFVLVMFLLFVVLFLFIDLAHEFLLNRARVMNFRKNNTDTEVFEVMPPYAEPLTTEQQEADEHDIDSAYRQLKAKNDRRRDA